MTPQDLLSLHQNDLHALVALDSEVLEDVPPHTKFRFRDIFQKSVLHPFLVILVLMFLLQFSGQGAITFYTVQIFTVSIHYTDNLYKPSRCVSLSAAIRSIGEVVQSRRRPLLGPSPG